MGRRATWETKHCGRFIFHAEVPLNTCKIQEQIIMHVKTDLHLQLLLQFLHHLTWEDFSARHGIFTSLFVWCALGSVRKKGRKIYPICVLWQQVGQWATGSPNSPASEEDRERNPGFGTMIVS